VPGSIPLHVHGSSKHYYNLGCTDLRCIAKASAAKAANRARRRAERVRVDGRMVHPDLAPVDSDSPRRHGTKYARTTFQCECEHCRPVLAALPGTLMWHSHLDGRVAVVAAAVMAVAMLWHTIPVHDIPKHITALARTAHMPVGFTVALALAVLAVRAKPGKHSARKPERSSA
jgi:hypothetical protein